MIVARAVTNQVAIMAAAAHDFAEDRDGIRLKLVAVESLAESSRALQEGHADLAVVRSDLAMPPNGQTVLIMRRDAAVLFAPAESSLRAIDDLRGHKVGVLQAVPPGKVDNQLLLDTALAQYDVPSASVGRVSLTLAELSRVVENKEIDAVLRSCQCGQYGRLE
jgi:ABC-type nitrate/sulfonate/bicarbonate transport system substrate-binding protein